MRPTLLALNALAIAAAAAFVTLAVIYDPRGEWGAADALKVSVFLIPSVAAVAALRKRSSSLIKSIAAWCSVVWAALMAVLGLGAATGIGGFQGSLIVIIPALLVLAFNWFALRPRERAPLDA